jgi:hypothetical protein
MRYLVVSHAMPTIAPPVLIVTGTGLLTLLQVKLSVPARIVEWGISFNGYAAVQPGTCELIETDVAATITPFVDADITKTNNIGDAAAPSTAGFLYGVNGSGYNASAEGVPTASRNLDACQQLPPTGPYIKQIPLDDRPLIQINKFARIRVKFAVSVNALAYMYLDL